MLRFVPRFVLLALALGFGCTVDSSEQQESSSGEEVPALQAQNQSPGSCRPLECRLYCPNGFAHRDGCPVCMCAQEGESPLGTAGTGRTPDDSSERPQCDPIALVCQLHCENGFQFADNGCAICACRE